MSADALPAGRELDILVAERVMGLVPCDQWRPMNLGAAGGPVMMGHSERDSPHPGVECYSAVPGLEHPYNGPDRYSTEIRAAWLVVERMREQGWRWSLGYWPGTLAMVEPEALGLDPDQLTLGPAVAMLYLGYSRSASGSAEMMPEAICRAALAAVDAKGGA